VIPAEGSRREADRGSHRRRQARARGEVAAPAGYPTRPVRLQFSRGHVPATPGAACAGHGPELWFSDSQADIAQAKAICQGCQDRVSCLSGAIERRETYGIWGGTDFNREHHQEDVA
jgi:WhiB family transcriptional regulator, redox-sensing transcriptional regulator